MPSRDGNEAEDGGGREGKGGRRAFSYTAVCAWTTKSHHRLRPLPVAIAVAAFRHRLGHGVGLIRTPSGGRACCPRALDWLRCAPERSPEYIPSGLVQSKRVRAYTSTRATYHTALRASPSLLGGSASAHRLVGCCRGGLDRRLPAPISFFILGGWLEQGMCINLEFRIQCLLCGLL